ncbi:hypothetical protein GE09DRAFT_1114565 [Coniochaeta sp. 2T2.1]|nr:hypothetical protein GE09DRAFT_1114565 [Coniochaeta sp. 2T2.1]
MMVLFAGVFQPPNALPGFWIFMYRIYEPPSRNTLKWRITLIFVSPGNLLVNSSTIRAYATSFSTRRRTHRTRGS